MLTGGVPAVPQVSGQFRRCPRAPAGRCAGMVSVDEPVGDLCKVGAILCTRQEKLGVSSMGQHL